MPLAVVLVALIDVAAVMVGAEAAPLAALAFLHRPSDPVLRQHYNYVLFALFGFGVPVMPAVVALAILVGGLLVFFVALLLLVWVHFLADFAPPFVVVEATARRQ